MQLMNSDTIFILYTYPVFVSTPGFYVSHPVQNPRPSPSAATPAAS